LNKTKLVLIWGASSSFGAYAVQLAVKAGYTVVGVASGANAQLVKALGASHFVDRKSSNTAQELVALGPFDTILAAADSAADQSVIGEVLAAQGGGTFLSTMGVRAGVTLPSGVSGFFAQFLDDYLDPKNEEFTRWVWWDYLEDVLATGDIQLLPVQVVGGLSRVQEAWNSLREGKVSGQRLVIKPDMD
jgi:NADPH:quinone reductase-like Zn-dependent oxidoreductase